METDSEKEEGKEKYRRTVFTLRSFLEKRQASQRKEKDHYQGNIGQITGVTEGQVGLMRRRKHA